MSIPHIEAERTRVNLVKHYRPIGPAAIVAAVAAAKKRSPKPLQRSGEISRRLGKRKTDFPRKLAGSRYRNRCGAPPCCEQCW